MFRFGASVLLLSLLLLNQSHCSLIESKNDNNKRMRHVIKNLVFQTTISIVSYLGNNKRECELLKGLSQKKEPNPFIQTNEFSCKSMERFSCLMLTTTIMGELVSLCNVSGNWAKSVSDYESILTCSLFFHKFS